MRLLSSPTILLFCAGALGLACASKSGYSPASRNVASPQTPSANATPPAECPAGQVQSGEGCVKECATSDDCGPGGYCQEFRSANPDGTIGPILAKGCENAAAPSSSTLVQMVRTSKLPSSACAGATSNQPTLGAAYSEQASMMQKMAKDLSVPFVEQGACKAAGAENSSYHGKPVSSAVWYCTVFASPDWDKVKRRAGDEEGGTNFSVEFALDSSGAIVAESLMCIAAG